MSSLEGGDSDGAQNADIIKRGGSEDTAASNITAASNVTCVEVPPTQNDVQSDVEDDELESMPEQNIKKKNEIVQNQNLSAALDAYESEIARLRKALMYTSSQYINASLKEGDIVTELEKAEDAACVAKLKHEMHTWDELARGRHTPIHLPALPEERNVRKQQYRAWTTSMTKRTHTHKLRLLEQELRQLETVVPLFRHELDRNAQGAVSQLIQPATNPFAIDEEEPQARYAKLEPMEEGLMRLWVDPLLEAEDLFLAGAVARFHDNLISPAYHATAMQLPLEDEAGRKAVVRAIVDSGAAWSAIDYNTMHEHFPNIHMLASDRKFKDASSNIMTVRGRIVISFSIGDLKLATTVYVFQNLGAPFLLGVNSLHDHGLALSTQRRVIFSESAHASPASTAPVSFAYLSDVMCHECADQEPEKYDKKCYCAQANQLTISCDPENHNITVTRLGVVDVVPFQAERVPISHVLHTKSVSSTSAIGAYESVLRLDRDYKIRPGVRAVEVRLEYDSHCVGPVRDLRVRVLKSFQDEYHGELQCVHEQLHNSINASVPLLLTADPRLARTIVLKKGTPIGVATVDTIQSDEVAGVNTIDTSTAVTLRTILDPPASPLVWRVTRSPPEAPAILNGTCLVVDRRIEAPELITRLKLNTVLSPDEWMSVKPPVLHGVTLRMSHHLIDTDGNVYQPANELTFQEGGRPRTRDDLIQLGFSLETAIDPCGLKDKDGNYPPLPETHKQRLYDIALKWYGVWSRDAKTPELSRLVVIDVPTGDAMPIAQRPYPVPFKYLEAVRKEIQKLLDGGLIEPTVSSWASPILVRLKKDSTPNDIRLKIIVDYRRLNEVTIPDAAGLGNQEEILHGFGGNQRYCGIVDAAGGFYQFLINPLHRHRTAFCLPTAMGGTSFQWRVAPYGLTRNPAGYSRGMMFALKGLSSCEFPTGTGGASSWIDDVAMHADSFGAFCDLFETVLMRIAFAGMSLKASKCFLLHQRLEVLGYHVTPDGLIMQEDKLKSLRSKRDKDGKIVGPSNVKEIRTFLGAVQFYRRFVPRLALLAAPMNELLKKFPEGDLRLQPGTVEHKKAMDGVQQSYEAILMFLQSSAVVSAPDFQDPLAEFVICTDACNVAVGGVLLQWQWPVHGENGPGPPVGTPLRAGKGSDPLTQSWRLDAGWKLRTIEYYSKTLDTAQRNYPTFDQEGAAVLLCCRKWAQLITCHPTTVYTDSSVAATMLTKHLGPPRLQRWGMELGTFLPYLKIQHRRGVDNGMADFLSRFPTFERYIAQPTDVAHLPEDDYLDVAEVSLFSHKLVSEDDQVVRNWRYKLVEDTSPKEATLIWQGHVESTQVDALTEKQTESECYLEGLTCELRRVVENTSFWQEQKRFDAELSDWQQYVDIFHTTHGRMPVVYDLYCGEGGFSRGARAAGCECHGFDLSSACRHRYENEPSFTGQPAPSCMTFHCADVSHSQFWDALASLTINGVPLPRPDMVHCSPPSGPYVRTSQPTNSSATRTLDQLISRLKEFEQLMRAKDGRPLMWQVESIPESRAYVTEPVTATTLLCGTMMGHRVFRHRLFYSNYALAPPVSHDHHGKLLSPRGSTEPNGRQGPTMYGVYTKPYRARGTPSEWHGALGALPNTYSARGIIGCLPTGYGRLTASQMVAQSLHAEYGCPVWRHHEVSDLDRLCLQRWANTGYQALRNVAPHATAVAISALADDAADTAPTSPLMSPVVGDSEVAETLGVENATLHEKHSFAEWQWPDEPFSNEFTITTSEQQSDVVLAGIIRKLENTIADANTSHNTLRANYEVRSGLLYRKDFAGTDIKYRLCVPEPKRTALMILYHYSNHRGHEVLLDQLHSYWWPNMSQDCEDFTAQCQVCSERRSGGLQRVPPQPVPTPSQPFSVIHVDHKGPLPRQSGSRFTNILVTVCALTRFALLIPVEGTTADETLRVLVARVFCVFGTPAVIVSDNGPAFRSELTEKASKFFGYRHIHTLPYNPQANGVAEATVKRIKLLLEKQTKDYADWHRLLPLAQHMLNTTVHTSLGLSPYEALFGREPVGLEKLENPALYPTGDGNELLSSIKQRMLHLHTALRAASDAIKNARIDATNKYEYAHLKNAKRGTVLPSTPGHDRYVWLLYGSKENADYIRKHGHGAPWRYRYKVLEVRPHAVRLEIPKDGSVPRVLEWQSMRRVSVAHDNIHEPTGYEPYMTEYGLTTTNLSGEGPTDEDLADVDTFEIESIVRADRIGRDYKLWIKWKDHTQITPRWRSELLKETSNSDVLADIKRVVHEAKLRADITQGRLDDEDDDLDDAGDTSSAAVHRPPPTEEPVVVGPTVVTVDPDLPIGQRLPRRQVRGKSISTEQISLVNTFLSDVAYSNLSALQLSQHLDYASYNVE